MFKRNRDNVGPTQRAGSLRVNALRGIRDQWKISIVVGLLIIAALVFGFVRPQANRLDTSRAELETARATTATLERELAQAQQADSADLEALEQRVLFYDTLLPYWSTDENLSPRMVDLTFHIPNDVYDLLAEGVAGVERDGRVGNPDVQTQTCSELNSPPLFELEVNATSPTGTTGEHNSVYVEWLMRYQFADPIPYSSAEAQQCATDETHPRTWEQMDSAASEALVRALANLDRLEPLTVITDVVIDVPQERSGDEDSDRGVATEPLYTLELTARTYAATEPGLAQITPAAVPVLNLAGYELVPDSVSPGTAAYEASDGNRLTLTYVPSGSTATPGATLVIVNAPDNVILAGPDDRATIALQASEMLPLPSSELRQRITLTNYVDVSGGTTDGNDTATTVDNGDTGGGNDGPDVEGDNDTGDADSSAGDD